MRILVDKMPTKPTDCPYCIDNSTKDFDEYDCIFRNGTDADEYCSLECSFGCPYFTEMPSARDIVDEGLAEREGERMSEMGWGW